MRFMELDSALSNQRVQHFFGILKKRINEVKRSYNYGYHEVTSALIMKLQRTYYLEINKICIYS